jgi:hypothetical protein
VRGATVDLYLDGDLGRPRAMRSRESDMILALTVTVLGVT